MQSRIASAAVLSAAVLAVCACATDKPAAPPPAAPAVALADPDPPACGERSFAVYFAEWETDPGQEGRRMISAAQGAFAGCVIEHVRIVGMADATGDERANIEVSQKRAEVIAEILARGGWPRDRFELVAVGERGATRDDGAPVPMRRIARVEIASASP